MNKQTVADQTKLTENGTNRSSGRYSLRERRVEKQIPSYYGDYEFEYEENYRKRKSRRFKGNHLKKRKPMVGSEAYLGS